MQTAAPSALSAGQRMQTPHEVLAEELGLFAASVRRELQAEIRADREALRADREVLQREREELKRARLELENEVRERLGSLHDGKDGRDGIDGAVGERGIDGTDGKDGERGLDGTDGKDGRAGIDGTVGERGIDGAHGMDGAPGNDGAPGKDADPHEIAALLVPEVERAVAGLPKAQDGKDADPAVMQRMIMEAVGGLPPARNGKDADPVEIAAILVPKVKEIAAPDDIADDIQKAIWMLAESPPIVRSEKSPQFSILSPSLAARSFRFERDEQNRIVAAHAEEGER